MFGEGVAAEQVDERASTSEQETFCDVGNTNLSPFLRFCLKVQKPGHPETRPKHVKYIAEERGDREDAEAERGGDGRVRNF